jgi:uncharacterized phage-associated protein
VAWGYAVLNKEICARSEFQAWVHGPVSPTIYACYREFDFWDKIFPDTTYKNPFDREINSFLESVWETYGDQTDNSLEALTHTETPWKKARRGHRKYTNCKTPIAVDDMKTFYRSIYSGGNA